MPSARSAALAILASSSPSSVVVKRTWPASVWRWMKVALSGGCEQLVAVLRGHLDEIAEHVVVPDLERAHAGLLGIARLQRRDHAARFVAQRARLVERGVVARAHEAAVALEQRQLVAERRGKLARDRGVGLAQARSRPAATSAGRAPPAVELGGEARRGRRCRRGSRRGRAGRRGRRPGATARGRDRARLAGVARIAPRSAGVGDEMRHRIVPLARSPPDRSAAPPAAAPAAASPPPSRCGRWRRAASRAARRRACAPARDWRGWPDRSRASRLRASRSGGDSGGRWPSCVRST